MIVTIDGVAASGKSSVASGVARRLQLPYVSSGLLYRAAALVALDEGLPTDRAEPLLASLEAQPVELRPLPEGNEVWRGSQDLTERLHTSEVDGSVSAVAQLQPLREWVNDHLRQLPPPFVAEGRDMGTNVFPQAEYKFYLTASPRVRAERRVQERTADLESVEAALVLRDARDARQSAPAPDARHIDTGLGNLEQVIAKVLSYLPDPA
ncbi:(d)CMP kinase [Deinococcus sonorensis]|uniref:Cytidylate kinase n=2 Tax=Deinococcus sonorensis TaxID=309891 RepID=A0AAU7UDT1_9DEIO